MIFFSLGATFVAALEVMSMPRHYSIVHFRRDDAESWPGTASQEKQWLQPKIWIGAVAIGFLPCWWRDEF
jgi:hypothetical protein